MPINIPVTQTGLEASIEAAAKKAGKNLKINLGTSAKSIEGLSQPLGRITGKADQFTKSMEAANARVLAFGASVGVLSSVTRGFKELINVTVEVEKSLTSINSILNVSAKQLDSFKDTIFNVARVTEQSFETVASAALELSRQGLEAEQVVKRLNDALILSRLSGLGSAEAVSGLTAALNSFKKEGVTSEEVLNKLSAASIKAAVSERDLIEAIKRSGSVAQTAGVSLDELVGVVSAVQERTARGGAVIGNSFKTIFTRIQSLDKLKTMQNLGVEITDASGAILSGTKLIQNLARTIETLPEAKRLQIAENLVGKFQIAPFLAILDDYNSKTSKAIEITGVAASATNEAYNRNIALNNTLSAAINEATVNLQQLAVTLGEIGVTDSLKNILGFFNNLVTNITGLLDEETGSNIAKGLVKGIGSVISGPGLAIFGAIIAKLTIDLVKFGTGSLKTFFGLNKVAKEQATIQGQIASTLLGNKGIQDQILAIERSQLSTEQKRAAQTKFFTTALNEQLAVMQRMQGIAARIAPGVRAGTRRAAGGYIPNFSGGSVVGSEQGDINRGVGGAPRSARPVVIPNFALGGGKRGTIVANTSEYIVPNFAGGGSAIFNQDMVASMGLPSGARRVGASRGYIPNFAKASGKGSKEAPFVVNHAGMIVPDRGAKGNYMQGTFGGTTVSFPVFGIDGAGEKTREGPDIVKQVKDFGLDLARREAQTMTGGRPTPDKELKLGNAGSISALAGTIFEAALSALKKSKAFKFGETATFDFVGANTIRGPQSISDISPSLKNSKVSFLEAKVSTSLDNRNSMAKKIQTYFGNTAASLGGDQFSKGKATKQLLAGFVAGGGKGGVKGLEKELGMTKATRFAGGYIPNFDAVRGYGAGSDPLREAINRESSAGLPINQVRINQSGKLRRASNPMGLAVTNTRDEPTGQIPNYAAWNKGVTKKQVTGAGFNYDKAGVEAFRSSVSEATKGATELAQGQRDLLGPIFAVQAGLSFLGGATEGASSALGRYTNIVSEGLSGATSAAFAGVALKDFGDQLQEGGSKLGGALGGMVSKLGVWGAVAGGLFSAFKMGVEIFNEVTGANDRAAMAAAKLADATGKLTFKFNSLSQARQLEATQGAEEAVGGRVGVTRTVTASAATYATMYGGYTGGNRSTVRAGDTFVQQMKRDFGSGEAGEQLEQSFIEASKHFIAMGKTVQEVDAMLDEFGKDLDDADLLKFQKELVLTEREFQNTRSAYIEAVKANEALNAGTMEMQVKVLENFSQALRGRQGGDAREEALETIKNTKGFEDLKNLPDEEIAKIVDQRRGELAQQIAKDRNRADIANLNSAKLDLKIAIERKKAQLLLNDAIGKRVAQAEILGRLSKDQMRELKRQQFEEGLSNKEAAKRLELLDKSLSQLEGVVGENEKISNAQKAIQGLTAEQLNDEDALRKILGDVLIITNELGDSRSQIIENILKGNDAELVGIRNANNHARALRSAADSAGALKDALTLASEVRLRNVEAAAFSDTFQTKATINQKQARIDQIGTALDAGGVSPSRRQTLENEVKKLTVEISQLERTVSEREVLKELQSINLPFDRTRAKLGFQNVLGFQVPTSVTDTNEERRDQLAKAKTAAEAIKLIEDALKTGQFTKTEEESLRKSLQAAKQKMEVDKQSADASVKSAEEQQRAAEALTVALRDLDLQTSQLGQMGLISEQLASERRRRAIARTGDPNDRQFFDLTPEQASRLSDLQRSVGDRLRESPDFDPVLQADVLADSLTRASLDFKNNISTALVDAIAKGEDLGDALRSAATDFFRMLSQAYMQNAVNQIAGGALAGGGGRGGILGFLGLNSGGVVRGGSGNKDDVPTLLTGGEFVLRKSAVKKYGPEFLQALNAGSIQTMQRGGLFTPGTYGQGPIVGKRNLLDFATQNYTTGRFDEFYSGAGFAGMSLEPQSGALTMFGRRNSPQFKREQASKKKAFGLYARQMEKEKQMREEEKRRKKAFRNSIFAAVISAGVSQFATGFGESMRAGQGFGKSIGAGFRGFEFGGQRYGGLTNLGGYQGPLPSQMSNRAVVVPETLGGRLFSGGSSRPRYGYGSVTPPLPTGGPMNQDDFINRGLMSDLPLSFVNAPRRAAGGSVPYTTGIDTVPTMLSGGEFVMNAGAADRIGRGNLASLNSGAGGNNSDITGRLDELINVSENNRGESVINITVNSDGTSDQTGNGDDNQQGLAVRIRDVVRQVIDEEKRLGGSLRQARA